MATPAQITALAIAAGDAANQFKGTVNIARQVVAHSQALGVNFGALPEGAVDGNGLIVGTNLTPGQVSNILGSANSHLTDFWPVHGVNFEQGAKPVV